MKKMSRLHLLFVVQLFLWQPLFAAEKVNESIDLAGNRQATWYLPDGTPRALVLMQHGFQRNKNNLDHIATTFMNQGFMVLTINSSTQGGNASLGRNIADAIIDNMPSPPNGFAIPNKLIVAGHSAGALMMSHTGSRLAERNHTPFIGAILWDPVDASNGLEPSMQAIENFNVPVYSILANSSSCNSSNNAWQPLQNLNSAFVGIKLTNSSNHTDAEGDSTGGIITWLCGNPKDYNVNYLQDFSLNWAIDMAEGSQNPAYYPGGSKVQQLINDNDGILIKEIIVYDPVADFSFSANNLVVTFNDQSSDADGTIESYSWDFDGQGQSTEANPTFTFAQQGEYNVTLTVTDNDGNTGSTTKTVLVSNGLPIADFSYSASGLSVDFTDNSSDSNGTIDNWSWDFGDGNTSTQQNPSHTFGADGSYTVSLMVMDNDNNSMSVSKTIEVTEDPAKLNNPDERNNLAATRNNAIYFYMDVPQGATDLNFSIQGGSGDADIYIRKGAVPTTSQYDYRPYLNGNNETVSIPNPAADVWHVMIRAYSTYSGVTLNASFVDPGLPQTPTADFSFTTDQLVAQFTDLSADPDGSIQNWSWSFGDGNHSSVQNPTHTYSTEGTYTVTLTVTDNDGYDAQQSREVSVSSDSERVIQNGVPITDLSDSQGGEQHFVLNLTANTANLEFAIQGGSGDADIYIRYGQPPTTSQFDYRPYRYGNDETVSIPSPQTGKWYVMIRAYRNYSGLTLTGNYQE